MSSSSSFARTPLLLGRVVATLEVMVACSQPRMLTCVKRHARGDWGCVSRGDWSRNDEAVRHGSRVVSAYPIDPKSRTRADGWNTFLIVTDADRKLTTIMLPSELETGS
jgi:hypothetical protein